MIYQIESVVSGTFRGQPIGSGSSCCYNNPKIENLNPNNPDSSKREITIRKRYIVDKETCDVRIDKY